MRTDREGWSESRCEDVIVVAVGGGGGTMGRRAASSADAPRRWSSDDAQAMSRGAVIWRSMAVYVGMETITSFRRAWLGCKKDGPPLDQYSTTAGAFLTMWWNGSAVGEWWWWQLVW